MSDWRKRIREVTGQPYQFAEGGQVDGGIDAQRMIDAVSADLRRKRGTVPPVPRGDDTVGVKVSPAEVWLNAETAADPRHMAFLRASDPDLIVHIIGTDEAADRAEQFGLTAGRDKPGNPAYREQQR